MKKILKGGLLALVLILLMIIVLPLLLPFMGWQADPVLSGSMGSALPFGSMAFTRSADPYQGGIKEGDILVYRHPIHPELRVSHRVIEVRHVGLQPNFRTKGDANEAQDPYVVSPRYIEGVVEFSVPLLGHLLRFARTDAGRILFIVLPGFVIIAWEGKTIWNALVHRKNTKKTEQEA